MTSAASQSLPKDVYKRQVKVFEAQEDVVIVTNTENPLSARDDVHLADLVSHPFILMNLSLIHIFLFFKARHSCF